MIFYRTNKVILHKNTLKFISFIMENAKNKKTLTWDVKIV